MNGVFAFTLPTEFLVDWEVEMANGYCLEMDFGDFQILHYHWFLHFSFLKGKILVTNILSQTGLSGNCFKWGDAS